MDSELKVWKDGGERKNLGYKVSHSSKLPAPQVAQLCDAMPSFSPPITRPADVLTFSKIFINNPSSCFCFVKTLILETSREVGNYVKNNSNINYGKQQREPLAV